MQLCVFVLPFAIVIGGGGKDDNTLLLDRLLLFDVVAAFCALRLQVSLYTVYYSLPLFLVISFCLGTDKI